MLKFLIGGVVLLSTVASTAGVLSTSDSAGLHANGSVAIMPETGLALDWVAFLSPTDSAAGTRTVSLFLQLRYSQVIVEQRHLTTTSSAGSTDSIIIAPTEVDPGVAQLLAMEILGLDKADPAAAEAAFEAATSPVLIGIKLAPSAGLTWGTISDGSQLVVSASQSTAQPTDAPGHPLKATGSSWKSQQ